MKNIKVSIFPTILSIVTTVALAYLVCHISRCDENCVLLTIGTFVSVLLTLAFAMSVKFQNKRVGMNVKVCSVLCFFIMYIVSLCIAWIGVNVPIYVILQSVLVAAYLFVVWKLSTKNV